MADLAAVLQAEAVSFVLPVAVWLSCKHDSTHPDSPITVRSPKKHQPPSCQGRVKSAFTTLTAVTACQCKGGQPLALPCFHCVRLQLSVLTQDLFRLSPKLSDPTRHISHTSISPVPAGSKMGQCFPRYLRATASHHAAALCCKTLGYAYPCNCHGFPRPRFQSD